MPTNLQETRKAGSIASFRTYLGACRVVGDRGATKVPVKSEDEDARKEGRLDMKQNARAVVKSAIHKRIFIFVRYEWFPVFIGREIGAIYDSRIAEISRACSKITELRCEPDYNLDEQ